MPTRTFQEQATVTEPRCQKNVVARVTQVARVCLDGWPRRSSCNELEFLRFELRLIMFDDDVIKDMGAGLLPLRQVSGV